ncbi:hypothetical protein RB195_018144 [Necator americanus]|uniref:Uncharacterized protein n=1 Tax=Necator americanus TaxID=51031 RepID=A0ABR1CBF6_NECAM
MLYGQKHLLRRNTIDAFAPDFFVYLLNFSSTFPTETENRTSMLDDDVIFWKEVAFLGVIGFLTCFFFVLTCVLICLLRLRLKSGEKCSEIFKMQLVPVGIGANLNKIWRSNTSLVFSWLGCDRKVQLSPEEILRRICA